jgi:predicted DNA-binding protein
VAEQIPLIPTVKSTFRLPQDLYRRLKIEAVQESRTIAEVLIDAIDLYLSRVGDGHDQSSRAS